MGQAVAAGLHRPTRDFCLLPYPLQETSRRTTATTQSYYSVSRACLQAANSKKLTTDASLFLTLYVLAELFICQCLLYHEQYKHYCNRCLFHQRPCCCALKRTHLVPVDRILARREGAHSSSFCRFFLTPFHHFSLSSMLFHCALSLIACALPVNYLDYFFFFVLL